MNKRSTLTICRFYFHLLLFTIVVLHLSFDQCLSQAVIFMHPAITTGLVNPVDMASTNIGSKKYYVAQKNGTIKVYDDHFNYLRDFLKVNVKNTSGGANGLYSIAFHPDYINNHYFFVYYASGCSINIARFQTSSNPDSVDVASKVTVLSYGVDTNACAAGIWRHEGGKMNFGEDGYLYISTGDERIGTRSQDLSLLKGKMLCINVNTSNTAPYYTIPPDNPYVNDTTARPEIWASGLSFPYRWSFDSQTGDMWIGDQSKMNFFSQEVEHVAAGTAGGMNFGWPYYRGNTAIGINGDTSGLIRQHFTFPFFSYPDSTSYYTQSGYSYFDSAQIIGGYKIQGYDFYGSYLFADKYYNNIWILPSYYFGSDYIQPAIFTGPDCIYILGVGCSGLPDGSFPATINSLWQDTGINNVSFYPNPLYGLFGSDIDGSVYELDPGSIVPVTLMSFDALRQNNFNEIKWKTAHESALADYTVEYSYDAKIFYTAGDVKPENNINGSSYSFRHDIAVNGTIYYRLKTTGADGKTAYSKTIRLYISNNKNSITITPTVISHGNIQVHLNESFDMLEIYNSYGQKMMNRSLSNQAGSFTINASSFPSGIYTVVAYKLNKQESSLFIVQ